MEKDSPRHGFTRWVLVIKGNDAVAIHLVEEREVLITCVHAQGMVKAAKEAAHHFLNDLEIHDHIIAIQRFCGKNKLDAARMPMGELAIARVLGKQMAAF